MTSYRENDSIVIAGAGMTGLIAALLLRRRYPQYSIIIIERSEHIGGNYHCIQYPQHGLFDQGMRIYYDTGISEIDDVVEAILPPDSWHILHDNNKDIAGIFWNGRLQTYSPFLDFRSASEKEYTLCKETLFQASKNHSKDESLHANTALVKHFGSAIAEHLEAVLHKLYGLPADHLGIQALRQPAMNRVILFNEDKMADVFASETLQARIAWPNQLTFPPELRNFRQRGLYPKTYGMDTILTAIRKTLEISGVRFIFQQSITSLHYKSRQIVALETSGNISIAPRHVIWTAGLQPLFDLISQQRTTVSTCSVGKAYLVHMRLKEEPRMGKLYHFYCFDEGYRTFRVTNYFSYCPNAYNQHGYPICIELWYHENNTLTSDHIQRLATEELLRMGIILNENDVQHCGITPIANLHSMYTLKGIDNIHHIRNAIYDANINNLTYAGIFSNDNALLLYEVLQDLHQHLASIQL